LSRAAVSPKLRYAPVNFCSATSSCASGSVTPLRSQYLLRRDAASA
jgi:hypothetical protein